MIQQLRSKLGRLQMLAQKKVGIDPKELHELLREMDIRSGGDGEYWLVISHLAQAAGPSYSISDFLTHPRHDRPHLTEGNSPTGRFHLRRELLNPSVARIGP